MAGMFLDSWNGYRELPKFARKQFGIDVKKIVEAHLPKHEEPAPAEK